VQLLRIIPDDTKIPFMRSRHLLVIASVVVTVLSLGWAGINGLNFGIDFKGGSAIEVQSVSGPADPGTVRQVLRGLDIGEVQVQNFGTPEDLLVRIELQPGSDTAQQAVVTRVQSALSEIGYEVRRTESISGTVSGELALSGIIGLSVALIGILIYLWFRFEWQFAVGAIITTAHDVVLTIGFFAFTGMEFNASSIAAILTIVGYSLNDTVVVYDRIREYRLKYKKMNVPQLIDIAINSTLPRTIITSTTTFVALMSLVIFGGEVIRSFTASMAWGVLVGTYSSIFIAAPILIYLGLKSRADVAETKPEEKRADGAMV
jgi:SecD/SecF fusion protein